MLQTLIAASTIRERGVFESTWNTTLTSTGSSNSNQIKLPTQLGQIYNFVIDWGDGTIEAISSWDDPRVTHTYVTPGVKQLKIEGVINSLRFNDVGDKLKIISIERWGCFRSTNSGTFFGCANLKLDSVVDVLNTSGCTGLGKTFEGCTSLVTINRLNEWNVSKINGMNNTFLGCTLFNSSFKDLVNPGGPSWNTSKVTNFNGFLYACEAFNQDISNLSFLNCSVAGLFLRGKSPNSYTPAYMDSLLISMANNPMNNTGWNFDCTGLKRTIASNTAYSFLTDPAGRNLTIPGITITV